MTKCNSCHNQSDFTTTKDGVTCDYCGAIAIAPSPPDFTAKDVPRDTTASPTILRGSLQIGGDRTIPNPTDKQIRDAMTELKNMSKDQFAILCLSEMEYIQTAGADGVWVIEYQEGSLDEHYAAVNEDGTHRAFQIEEISSIFIEYRNGTDQWKNRMAFAKAPIQLHEDENENGSSPGCLILLVIIGVVYVVRACFYT